MNNIKYKYLQKTAMVWMHNSVKNFILLLIYNKGQVLMDKKKEK